MTTLAELKPGQTASVLQIDGSNGPLKRRMTSLGIIPGCTITLDRSAPLGDPRIYNVKGYNLGLRNSEASAVSISLE